ncbi:hypothetical protein CDL27_01775 [Mediterraneibacter gnavus]|nr:hypothetical protein CDL27_01775 [Mediterraneibacter gnavus]
MVDGTGIIGVDMICPLGVSTPQPPNYDRVELEGTGMLVLPNSLDAPLERLELGGKTEQVQTSGKNLLNSNIYVQGYLASIDTGQKISLNTEVKSFTTTMDINALQGKSISISIRTKGNSGKKYAFTDEEDVIINGKFDAGMADYSEYNNIQVPQNAKKFYFSVTYEVQENTKLQLEYGNKATSYEPYTGGKPSPSPEYPQEIKNSGKWNEETRKYEVDVKVTGKNRFDREKAKDVSNWISIEGDGYLKFPIRAKKGSMITFSYTEKLTEGKKFYLGIAKKETGSVIAWLYHDTNLSVSNSKYTIAAEEDYVYLMCTRSSIRSFLDTIQTLQVEISPAQTDYQPYAEQSLTITSDRPITKWDKLVEQGGQIGWLYNSVNETIDGKTGKWSIQPASKIFYRTDITFPIAVPFCSELLGYDYSSVGYKKDTGISINNLGILCITLPEEVELTLDAYKQYLADNPLHVLYKDDSEEFVPLPQSEQNAIRALKAYYPTTVITVDGGELDPDIKVTYRKEI